MTLLALAQQRCVHALIAPAVRSARTVQLLAGGRRRMPEKEMLVSWDDGAHLSQSHKKPGEFSPLTRDDETNDLGHVTLREIGEDDEDSPTSSPPVLVVALASLAVGVAATKAAPYVARWWNTSALPAMRSAVTSTRHRLSGTPTIEGAELVVSIEAAPTDPSDEVEAATHAPGICMSFAEWQDRFRLMLVAGAVQDEQWQILTTARVDDGDGLLEVQSAMEKLSPAEVTESTGRMLEANPLLLDEATSARVMDVPRGAPLRDSERVPVRIETVRGAPRLTDGGVSVGSS